MFAESDLSVTVAPSNISCSAAPTFEKIDKVGNNGKNSTRNYNRALVNVKTLVF